MHQRSLIIALNDALERTLFKNRKHFNRHFLIAAQGKGGGIHHAQIFANRLVK